MIKMISERVLILDDIIRKREMMLKRAPAGRLRVNCGRKNPQYYQVIGDNLCGRYLGRHQRKQILALAQKDYDERVLRAAKHELRVLERLKRQLGTVPEDVYEALPAWRKELVRPIRLPDDMYVQEWEQEEFFTKGVADDNPEFRTKKGEQVRSKSEILIANTLLELGIPYRYECELELQEGIALYPDFTVLHVKEREEKYLEHFGMMDVPEYCGRALKRLALLQKNGIFPGKQLFMTFETREQPLNTSFVKELFTEWFL